jgi:putative transposase
MKAKTTALLLADLGVTRSHSRPHTSNDNPFSESQFKNLKYQPQFPRRFGCIEDARGFSAFISTGTIRTITTSGSA